MADTQFFKGDNFTLTIEVTDGSGADVDLSDAQAGEYGIFDAGGVQHVSKQIGSGVTIAANIVTIALQPSDTATMAPGSYLHELEVIDAAGAVHTVYQGEILIRRDYILSEEPAP